MAAAARQIRQFFGPLGNAVRRDASAATAVEEGPRVPRTFPIFERGLPFVEQRKKRGLFDLTKRGRDG